MSLEKFAFGNNFKHFLFHKDLNIVCLRKISVIYLLELFES